MAALLVAALAPCAPFDPELLGSDSDWREIPFVVVEERPLIAASVNGTPGRMMFDTGTPVPVLVNRDAVALDGSEDSVIGRVSSGQAIEILFHEPQLIEVEGVPLDSGPRLLSGDFEFTEVAFGADFLGFVGTPAVEQGAFLLDYDRGMLTVFRTGPDGALAVAAPDAEDIVARFTFERVEGEQPTTGAFIGSLSVVLDFDTGDTGTLYLRPESRAALEAEGLLVVNGDQAVLGEVRFGGGVFRNVEVEINEAGGAGDGRTWSGSNALRLGSGFFSENPSVWNFPDRSITVLRRGSAFLAPR